jgi:hypothetical protein
MLDFTERTTRSTLPTPSAYPDTLPAAQEPRGMLQAKLQTYMIPQAFVCLEALPLNANGKVDRGGLTDPDASSQVSTDCFWSSLNFHGTELC